MSSQSSSSLGGAILKRVIALLILIPLVYFGFKIYLGKRVFKNSAEFEIAPAEFFSLHIEPDPQLAGGLFDISVELEISEGATATTAVLDEETYLQFDELPSLDTVIPLKPELASKNFQQSWNTGWVTVDEILESFVVVVYNPETANNITGSLRVLHRQTKE